MLSSAINSNKPSAATVASQMPHAVWRASQMASSKTATISSGFHSLDRELPNAGWPRSALIELLLQQNGIGEIQLLRPALTTIAKTQRIVLIQPPYLPQIASLSAWGLAPERLLWIKAKRMADTLWTAEQVLRNGSCGAMLLWQTQVRTDALRRLHLAAQASDTLFWVLRPLANAQHASPSPLRLALRAAQRGIDINIIKRRGPQHAGHFYLPLAQMPSSRSLLSSSVAHHAILDQCIPAATGSRDIPSVLV